MFPIEEPSTLKAEETELCEVTTEQSETASSMANTGQATRATSDLQIRESLGEQLEFNTDDKFLWKLALYEALENGFPRASL
ncbi:hypothetical protein M0804_013354 [Polistes exclamans]|nr:hypothetical protein M0804_013354 [Polistes exclamans]